jgi:hypothetical protein
MSRRVQRPPRPASQASPVNPVYVQEQSPVSLNPVRAFSPCFNRDSDSKG